MNENNDNEQHEDLPMAYVWWVCIALLMGAITFYLVANCVGGCR
jgi:hypothetical protein